jgi:hypothetical protein
MLPLNLFLLGFSGFTKVNKPFNLKKDFAAEMNCQICADKRNNKPDEIFKKHRHSLKNGVKAGKVNTHFGTFLYNVVCKYIIKENGGVSKQILPVGTALCFNTMSERLFHGILAAPAPLGE